jgi:hypothetical protein
LRGRHKPQALVIAHAIAWNLAANLMFIAFMAGNGFGIVRASEYDGDLDDALNEFDPFAP